MCGCIPLPSWAGGNARDDAPPTRRQERERYAEELRRERGLSFVADEEERRLEERLAELEAKHASLEQEQASLVESKRALEVHAADVEASAHVKDQNALTADKRSNPYLNEQKAWLPWCPDSGCTPVEE